MLKAIRSIPELTTLLQASLELDVPYEFKYLADGKPAAVLALFGMSEIHGPSLLVTRRTETLDTHKGQMAFPGGMTDPEDVHELGAVTTALRETEEEVGIPRGQVQVLGQIAPVWTISRYLVTPVAGVLLAPVEQVELRPNPDEIDRTLWVSLEELRRPGTYRKEWVEAGAVRYPNDVYQVGEYRIWGATGRMMKNLMDRIDAALAARGAGAPSVEG